MTLADAVRSGFRNFFRFSGRASRSEYWKFVLFVFLGCIAAIIVNSAIYGPEVINEVVTNTAKMAPAPPRPKPSTVIQAA